MRAILALLLLLTPAVLSLKQSTATFDLFTWQDLLRPTFMLAGIKSLFNQEKQKLGDVAKFSECTGPHEHIYDIDLDDSFTDPEFVKKSKDMTKMYLEGVMTKNVHVDNLVFDVYWNGNLFHSEAHK